MKAEISEWPLLLVSSELNAATDDGFRLRELTEELEKNHRCRVIPSFTYEDALEIFVEDDRIILTKYAPACIFCGEMDNLISYKDKKICGGCAKKINALFAV